MSQPQSSPKSSITDPRRKRYRVPKPMPLDQAVAVPPKAAARLLSLGLTRIYTLMDSGDLENFRSGRARRIILQSIEDYIGRQLAEAEQGATTRRASRMSAHQAEAS